MVSQSVVDAFEAIKVHHSDREPLSAAPRFLDLITEIDAELVTIWQPGQVVVESQVIEGLFPKLHFSLHELDLLGKTVDFVAAAGR